MTRSDKHYYFLLGKEACKYYRENYGQDHLDMVFHIHEEIKRYGLSFYVDGSGNLDRCVYEVIGWDDFVRIDGKMYSDLTWLQDMDILLGKPIDEIMRREKP